MVLRRVLNAAVVGAAGLCWLLSHGASAQLFRAELAASEWKVAAGPFACSLTHPIAGFGKAVFARKAGGGESFYLESQGKVHFPAGIAVLETLPPPWRSDLVPQSLGTFKAIGGDQPVILNATEMAASVAQLKAGVNVMTSSQALAASSSGASVVRVVLSAKNFSAAYGRYQQCVADIIPYSFAQLARMQINYPEAPEALPTAAKTALDKIVRYMKADPKVLAVYIDGHSDNAGTPEENQAVSKQMAEWVGEYLVGKGIASEKITTRWHGDEFVIANNKQAAGRAQNRRVTVRLEDEATRAAALKKDEANRQAAAKAAAKEAAESARAEAKKAAEPVANTSSSAKMSPEAVRQMVEGLELTAPKTPAKKAL